MAARRGVSGGYRLGPGRPRLFRMVDFYEVEGRRNSNLRTKQRSYTYTKRFYFSLLIYKTLPVESELYSVLYSLLSNISILLCFVPIVFIWAKKLRHEKAYLFTAIYWMVNGLLNLPTLLGFSESPLLAHHLTLLYNLMDAPMVLLIFLFAAPTHRKKTVLYTLGSFILFESITVMLMGYNLRSSTIIIGVGTFLAITFSIIKVLEYLQKIEHSVFENTMVFVYASLLFDYGIFIVIYLFSYIEVVKSNARDNFFIYYVSLLLSTFLTCFGLWRFAGKTRQVVPEPESTPVPGHSHQTFIGLRRPPVSKQD